MKTKQFQKLPGKLYQRDAFYLAEKLLGKYLVRRESQKYMAGKIVEVEAYTEKEDEASHSFNGKTKRNELMFASGGKLYVYFIYGNHFCCNVVCDKEGIGSAVLIRALEPLEEIELMAQRRFHKSEVSKKEFLNLINGPGKICKAFGISKLENGIDLCGDDIFITEGEKVPKKNIVRTSRIGIKKSKDLPWRFYIKDNPFISKK